MERSRPWNCREFMDDISEGCAHRKGHLTFLNLRDTFKKVSGKREDNSDRGIIKVIHKDDTYLNLPITERGQQFLLPQVV